MQPTYGYDWFTLVQSEIHKLIKFSSRQKQFIYYTCMHKSLHGICEGDMATTGIFCLAFCWWFCLFLQSRWSLSSSRSSVFIFCRSKYVHDYQPSPRSCQANDCLFYFLSAAADYPILPIIVGRVRLICTKPLFSAAAAAAAAALFKLFRSSWTRIFFL